ncbi:probable DNA double-strand break repair Rad50 ATPase isoform X2 [Battus philenor]|uniref:probable DNA double-strand break repair Rad50 ATPase isoform X2 n=1 Tax=Battus philenor TaxID=42288 RepID=UPI0035D0886B
MRMLFFIDRNIRDITNLKKDLQNIDQDDIYNSHRPKTLTDILKTVSEEAFKFVFPAKAKETSNLKEYISSRELLTQIKEKVNLLKERKKEIYEEKKSKVPKKRALLRETESEKHEIIEHKHVESKKNKVLKTIVETEIDKSDKKKKKPEFIPKSKKENLTEGEKNKKEIKETKVVKDASIKKKEKVQKPPKTKESEESGDGFRKIKQDKQEALPKSKKIAQDKNKITEKDSLTKAIEEARNKLKTQKESKKQEFSKKPTPPKAINLSRVQVRNDSIDEEHIGMIKIKQSPEQKIPQLPEQDTLLSTLQKRHTGVTREESDIELMEDDKLFQKSKLTEAYEIIIGQKIFKFKTPFVYKLDQKKEIQPLLFNSTFNENDAEDINFSKTDKNIKQGIIEDKQQPPKPTTLTAFGQPKNYVDKVENLHKEKELEKNYAPVENVSFSRVRIRNASIDEEHIKMIKIKQSVQEPGKRLTYMEQNVLPQSLQRRQTNAISEESELGIAADELLKKSRTSEHYEVILGDKILKSATTLINIMEGNKKVQPIFFETTFDEITPDVLEMEKKTENSVLATETMLQPTHNSTEPEAKGTVRYALSNRSFIDKGWTMLPTEKIVRKMNVYRMRPSHPEFDWFEHNKNKKHMHYESGETLADFQEDGRGRLYYRNGRLALDYYNAEEMNAGQRYVVYSNGEPDEKGRPRPVTVLATFDYLGNGIVFDHTGKVRLKYNQTEGVVLDREIGPVSHWKWHELNDPPVLQKIMIDTQMAVKDPEIVKLGGTGGNTPRVDNEEMLAIEFDNFIKEKSKKLSQKFKPFQIKMKALKINEHFSLRVLDQASVCLLFRDGTTNLKLNLGMILDHKEIVDTDTAELGEVTCNLERFPARTDSLAMLQRSVAHAQHVEKLRMDHERRVKVPEENPSIDRLTAAISRPLQPPVRNLPRAKCLCNSVKPPVCS